MSVIVSKLDLLVGKFVFGYRLNTMYATWHWADEERDFQPSINLHDAIKVAKELLISLHPTEEGGWRATSSTKPEFTGLVRPYVLVDHTTTTGSRLETVICIHALRIKNCPQDLLQEYLVRDVRLY